MCDYQLRVAETKRNLPASIHQRLLNLARAENRPLNELLQYYAIERFLYRLGQIEEHDRFILKGAQMLKVWSAPQARPTMDVDLLGKVHNSIENLEEIIRDCCRIDASDGVVFDPDSVKGETIRKDADYQGIRILAQGTLGKIRLRVQIDIGFGDKVFPAPIEIQLPQLLRDLDSPRLLGYTPESAIAEKFQAMVALDLTNTRLKDFYDIWLMQRNLSFRGKLLAEAIKTTFDQRQTEIPRGVPNALTELFTTDEGKRKQWEAFFRKNRLDVEIKLEDVAKEIESFLIPVTGALVNKEDFNQDWTYPQGWS